MDVIIPVISKAEVACINDIYTLTGIQSKKLPGFFRALVAVAGVSAKSDNKKPVLL